MARKNKNINNTRQIPKEAILEYISLGGGKNPRKKQIADEQGVDISKMQYAVARFKAGKGFGRKTRNDKGIRKKEIGLKTKLEFFAELASGSSIDEAQEKLGLSKYQGDTLGKEFAKVDKFRAIRSAPQRSHFEDLLRKIFRLDIAEIEAQMNGAFKIEVDGKVIAIPAEEINDIKAILAHCLQRDAMAGIDPVFKNMSKDQLERVRVYYLKEDLLEKKNVTEYTRLHRAVKPSTPEKQLDLKLVYAIIDRFAPGKDETSKIKIIKEEFEKLKMD